MEERPIQVKCPCCSAVMLIHPTHSKYHEYRMEIMREMHPEVEDDEQLELGCENLAPRELTEDEGKEDLDSHHNTIFGMTED